jgi:predicted secreted hydrolase
MRRDINLVTICWCLLVTACGERTPAAGGPTPIDALSRSDSGFTIATAPARLTFPADHGAHADFQTEWWYFTGNLIAADERRFGFQLTFFRYGLNTDPVERESAWATNQAWMAHFTVTDIDGKTFHARERFGRDALDLAGATADPFRVWLDHWSVAGPADGLMPLRLIAATDATSLELVLNSDKPIVLQGEAGFDAKGPPDDAGGNGSYYYSLTRLLADGRLRLGGEELAVTGTAWLDREWSTTSLGPELAGWDWFGLQLSDGTDLMIYQLRRHDGNATPFSGGSLVSPTGIVTRLRSTDVQLRVIDKWRSPATNTEYPVAWAVSIPGQSLELEVLPYLEDQELDLSVRYWEGAVRVDGRSGPDIVDGHGYLELVGY